MRKGRIIVWITASFIIGDITGFFIGSCLVFIIPLITFLSWFFVCKKSFSAMILCFALVGMSSSLTPTIEKENLHIFSFAAKIKNSASHRIDKLIPEGSTNELSLLKALSLGDKSLITAELKNNYKKSGAMHLLALSGLHVGIIYIMISFILSFTGNRKTIRILRTSLVLAFIWCYALITGLSSSISRAVIMITVYEISKAVSADKNLLNALSISALIITILNPEAPFEIGFQLSYCSMLSIYFIYPWLSSLLKCKTPVLKYVWNTVAMSITCQAGTFIPVLFYFGTFPEYFMITNLMAIPITGIILYLVPATVIMQHIPLIGQFTGKSLKFTLHLLNYVVKVIAEI